MIAFIVKSTICLVLFYLLYWVFLRKEKRFQFTRYFLLIGLLFSLSFPFVDFASLMDEPLIDTSHIEILPSKESIHSINGMIEEELDDDWSESSFSFWQGVVTILILGSLIMLIRFFKNLMDLKQLIKMSPHVVLQGISVVLLKRKVVPFSFGKNVFVNQTDFENGGIDADILNHEISHIKQWHTLDILLIEFVLALYWFNPILWFLRQAIKTNHEYLADQSVVNEDSKIHSYSKKLIDYLDDSPNLLLASSFNYSLTKNRLMMMTRSKTSRWQFVKKLSLLSGITIAFLAMVSFNDLNYPTVKTDNFVVVIDAGHGGEDVGATNNTKSIVEKDITLGIAKTMEELLSQHDIKVVMTRSGDDAIGLKERLNMANVAEADLMLSLHVNTNPKNQEQKGMEVSYCESNPNAKLAMKCCDVVCKRFNKDKKIADIASYDFLVLKEAKCPSIMVNLGFISNPEDEQFLSNAKNQKKIAKQLVLAVRDIQKSYNR